MIKCKLDPKEVRTLIDKYVAQREFALAKQSHVDARQCVYYAAGGALLAIFETITMLLAQMLPSDRAQALELRNLMQLALNHYQATEARRIAEARAHEGQDRDVPAVASNDPLFPGSGS